MSGAGWESNPDLCVTSALLYQLSLPATGVMPPPRGRWMSRRRALYTRRCTASEGHRPAAIRRPRPISRWSGAVEAADRRPRRHGLCRPAGLGQLTRRRRPPRRLRARRGVGRHLRPVLRSPCARLSRARRWRRPRPRATETISVTPLKRAWNSMYSLPSDSLLVARLPDVQRDLAASSHAWASGTLVRSFTCTR